jgi:hypothetical protein
MIIAGIINKIILFSRVQRQKPGEISLKREERREKREERGCPLL